MIANRKDGYNTAGLLRIAVAAALATPAVASAQSETAGAARLEEVVVTARKHEESLQSVPIAVTAMTEEALREKSLNNVYDLGQNVPGLQVRAGGANRTNADYFIRGQGATFGTQAAVVSYFNEVPVRPIGAAGGGAGNNIPLFDLESVQVLKGPQGTLFGRSSTGGAVLFSPKKPGSEFGGYLDMQLGNFDLMETSGAINVPLWEDKLAVRASAYVVRRDGFTDATNPGFSQALDDRHREAYRLGINFAPTDWFENYTLLMANNVDEAGPGNITIHVNDYLPQLNAAFAPFVVGGFCASMPPALQPDCFASAPARTARLTALSADLHAEADRINAGGSVRRAGKSDRQVTRARDQLIMNTTQLYLNDAGFLGDLTFKNIFSLHRVSESYNNYEIGSTIYPHGAVYSGGYNLVGFPQSPLVTGDGFTNSFGDDYTEEFQIQGDIDGDHTWIVGYFVEERKTGPQADAGLIIFSTFNNAFTLPLDNLAPLSPAVNETRIRQSGLFAQFTADLSELLLDGLSVTYGYRETKNKQSIDSYALIPSPAGGVLGGATGSLDFDESAPSWTFSLDYRLNPDTLVYLAHRRGFKPGGINTTSAGRTAAGIPAVPGQQDIYKPETLDDYELGLKLDWRLGSMPARTNLAIYQSQISNVQRNSILPAEDGQVLTQIANIAEAEINGLELESQLVLSERLQLSLNCAYIDAEYTKWPGTVPNIAGQAIALERSPFVATPEHQGSVGLRYALPLSSSLGQVSLYGEYYRQSGVWLDDQAILVLPDKPGYQDSYGNLNLRLDWNNVLGYPLDIGLFVRNALDDEWKVSVSSLADTLGIVSAAYNEPRMYGAQLRFRFGGDAKK